MCGIAGIFSLADNRLIEADTLRRMLAAVRHRGPDQFGIYLYRDECCSIGLGNARLSIIDLAGGQQPISNETGSLWIVYNGEIFNYPELQTALIRRGHRLATQSDTEVIVHLYEGSGPACLSELNGQFALAIWDENHRELFLARDRLGVRPLYYTIQNGLLIFGSEVKVLLASGAVTAQLDPAALRQIFTFWSPLSPRSAFRDIFTLPPGHWLRVRAGGEIETACYWRPQFPVGERLNGRTNGRTDVAESAAQLRELLVDATTIRLRADVPVGAYLSGGLDSSAIAALIHRYTENELETFSIAFSDAGFDESVFQRQMVAHLGTRHHLVTCTPADIGRVFPDVIWHTEVPILRTSPAPLFLLSRLVQDHRFKVVLTGEGADEFLAGYNIFKEDKVRRFWARQPESPWRPLLLRRLYPYIKELSRGNAEYLRRFFGQGLTAVGRPGYSHAIRWQNTGRICRLFSDQVPETARETETADALELPPEFRAWSPLAQAQYLEISIFLSEYLLSSQGDRVAMAHSVEGRFPFLDHRVVEFCNNLPPYLKLRGLNEKYLLKRAVQDLLPQSIRQRPKQPYRAPIHHSFFPDGRPLPWVRNLLSPESITAAGYFNPEAVALFQKKVERSAALGETDEMAVAGILSTQLVHDLFVANYRRPAPLADSEGLKMVRRGCV